MTLTNSAAFARATPGVSAAQPASRLPQRAGVGLKPPHFTEILETWPDLGFFEIHAENYLVAGGPFHHYLGRIRARYFAEDQDAAGARLLIDTHGAPIAEAVWELYAFALERLGPTPTLIERDNHLPPLAALIAEAACADRWISYAQHDRAETPA